MSSCQANQWIRRMESADGLKVAKMSDGQLLRMLETCIRLGLPMLIEAVGETLEAALEPVLLRQTYSSVSPGQRQGQAVVSD